VKKEDVEKALKLDHKDNKDDDKKDKDDDKKDDKKDDRKGKKGPSCESLIPECIAIDGVVRHTTVKIPFEFIVNVPGAKPDDCYKVICAEVKDDLGGDYIYYDETKSKTPDCNIKDQNFIVALIEKDIVKVVIKVFKDKH
jgi:hypothetical protein